MKNLIFLCILVLNLSSHLLAQDSSRVRTLDQLILGEWQLQKQYLKSFQSQDTLLFFEKGTTLTFTKDSLHIKNENTPRYYLQHQHLQYEIVKDSLNLFLTHQFKRKKKPSIRHNTSYFSIISCTSDQLTLSYTVYERTPLSRISFEVDLVFFREHLEPLKNSLIGEWSFCTKNDIKAGDTLSYIKNQQLPSIPPCDVHRLTLHKNLLSSSKTTISRMPAFPTTSCSSILDGVYINTNFMIEKINNQVYLQRITQVDDFSITIKESYEIIECTENLLLLRKVF